MILNFNNFKPEIHPTAFVADTANLIGQVYLAESSSCWFGAVLRADINYIKVGKFSNIQDLCALHVEEDLPLVIGDYVTVGHGACLHGCKIGNNVLVGIGAIVLNNAVIGDNCIIAAGSVVTENSKLDSGYLYMGIPAKPKRPLMPDEIDKLKKHAQNYYLLAKEYL